MCLLLVAWKLHPRHDLVLAANRDELHERPTGALDHWTDLDGVTGGRDLVAGGTWLAVHRDGRFAAVTNYRGGESMPNGGPSRGELITRFLSGSAGPGGWLESLARSAGDYAGFNLLVGDGESLWYASNRAPQFARPLPPGVHGLSNDLLGTPWPKLELGVAAMRAHVDSGRVDPTPLFDTMARQDSTPTSLPWPSGSGPFIAHERFGTRASTLLWREPGAASHFVERRFGPLGRPLGETGLRVPLAVAGGAS
jgi:uncharacterized protein with NRDE domain